MTMGVSKLNSNIFKAVAFLLAMIMFMLVGMEGVAFADTTTAQAQKNLTTKVYQEVQKKEYVLEGGGSISGKDLMDGKATTGYSINEENFKSLSSKAQREFVNDVATASNGAVGSGGVTDETVENWWKELQSIDGIGSQFLNEILKNTKPDFVTANRIYAPFSGVVGTVMGLIAVLVMALLGLVMIADISYITLPPVRNFVSDESGKGKAKVSNIFSHDAIYAVECAEKNSDSSSGGGKQALGIYLKRRVVMLIVLGICLLYLIQGQIYTLVGWILDLVSGFLGF